MHTATHLPSRARAYTHTHSLSRSICLSCWRGFWQQVCSLKPGESFGQPRLLDNKPRSATIVATTPTRLLFIPQDLYQRELHSVIKASTFPPYALPAFTTHSPSWLPLPSPRIPRPGGYLFSPHPNYTDAPPSCRAAVRLRVSTSLSTACVSHFFQPRSLLANAQAEEDLKSKLLTERGVLVTCTHSIPCNSPQTFKFCASPHTLIHVHRGS